MAGLSGIIMGALGLAALETVVSSDQATHGFSTLVQLPAQWARAFMDPHTPLIPNLAKAECVNAGDVSIMSLISATGDNQNPNVSPAASNSPSYDVPTNPSVPTPSSKPPLTA
jgi:hypothetical protein